MTGFFHLLAHADISGPTNTHTISPMPKNKKNSPSKSGVHVVTASHSPVSDGTVKENLFFIFIQISMTS